MAIALKICFEPGSNEFQSFVMVKYSFAKAEDIGVIVLPAHAGCELIPDHRGPNAGNFIGSDRHADPGAADKDAAGQFSLTYFDGEGFCVIWVIDRLVGVEVYAKVKDFGAE